MRRLLPTLMAALACASLAVAQTPAPNPPAAGITTRPSMTLPTTRPTQLPNSPASPESAPPPSTPVGPPAESLPVALAENLSNFDDRLADLRWGDGRWQLWAGPQLLKDFGRRESDARQALALIRELHLTQRGTVGSPRPIVEYWLSDGRVPTEAMPGLRTMPIDRASLRAEQVQGYWCVRDERSTFFNFGGHRDEAEQTVAIVKHYAFDRLALVGQPTPVMLLFLGAPRESAATTLLSPPSPKGRVVTPLTKQGTTEAVGDVTPSLLQSSRLRSSTALTPTPPARTSDSRNRQNPAPANDLAAAALSFNRQLAPPSIRSVDFSVLAERVPLDFRQARVSQDSQGWKLSCGNYVVARFATEREAKLGEMALHTSRFTEHCLIGHPKPAFSYFLVNGQPPRGVPLGAPSVTFRPDDLSVQQANGAWTICDLTRPLFAFGDKAEEAKEALKAIQRYQFDACCRLGDREQGMTILARTR